MISINHINQTDRTTISYQHTSELHISITDKPKQKIESADPYALLEKSMQDKIDKINQALEQDHGPNSLQQAYSQGVDISPEATANRIVQFGTQFFSSFREQNSDLSVEDAKKEFHKIISSAIDQGFQEAKDILAGMQVLEGEIATNIDKTYEIIQDSLQQWLAAE